jgi:hypothetical protein
LFITVLYGCFELLKLCKVGLDQFGSNLKSVCKIKENRKRKEAKENKNRKRAPGKRSGPTPEAAHSPAPSAPETVPPLSLPLADRWDPPVSIITSTVSSLLSLWKRKLAGVIPH